jgi:hypothetical protein
VLSYLGLNLSELDVLTAALNAQQASERDEKKGSNDDIQNRTAATFIQSCWQEKNTKGFKTRLRNCPFNLLVIRGRIILKREGMIRSRQGQIRILT